jgi:4-alpha-glucanotransferase
MEKQAEAQVSQTSKRRIGVVVPVGALRNKNSIGVGEFADLADFALLCKKMNVGLIQILPVNDSGYDSAPYFSLTAFALHPIYMRIEDMEEYKTAAPAIKDMIAEAKLKFGKEERYSHFKIFSVKMEIFKELYAANKDAIAVKAEGGSLAAWIEQNAWVKEFAVYRHQKAENGEKSWKEWTENHTVTRADIEALWADKELREAHLFWVWLQEALDVQFSKASKAIADLGIILEGDLPILMNEDSCDVWAHPEIFIQELSAGAPPDMYSPDGQNWGFPIYNWEAQEKDNYAWWRSRLAVAGKYYQAYRIDHVLGFFRIWASTRDNYSSSLGRYVPYLPVTSRDLRKINFDKGRIRWVTQPHIPTEELYEALRNNWGSLFTDSEIAAAANKIFSRALVRINKEELWLFKKKIKGEKDIDKLELHPAIRNYLYRKWRDRIFQEYEKGKYVPCWYYHDSRAWKTLSDDERKDVESILDKRRMKSEKIWETQGRKLLSILVESSLMLPCAEDLGAVPPCVPKVLGKLKILGLRVVRWFREWDKEGQPYISFEKYPELSVCTPSVHDSSTVRQWWETEANQEQFAGFIGVPSLPKIYNPGTAKIVLSKIATARSRFRVFQIQDLLHLSNKWYAETSASERINVPGTLNDFNWTYRLPAPIEEIAKDKDLIRAVTELGKIKPAKRL